MAKWTKAKMHGMGVPASKREYERCMDLITDIEASMARSEARKAEKQKEQEGKE